MLLINVTIILGKVPKIENFEAKNNINTVLFKYKKH